MIPFWHSVFKDDMTHSVCSPYLMRDFTHMFLPFPTVHPSPHLTSRCTLKRGASILLPLHNQTVRRRKPYPKTNSSWKLMVGRQLSFSSWWFQPIWEILLSRSLTWTLRIKTCLINITHWTLCNPWGSSGTATKAIMSWDPEKQHVFLTGRRSRNSQKMW